MDRPASFQLITGVGDAPRLFAIGQLSTDALVQLEEIVKGADAASNASNSVPTTANDSANDVVNSSLLPLVAPLSDTTVVVCAFCVDEPAIAVRSISRSEQGELSRLVEHYFDAGGWERFFSSGVTSGVLDLTGWERESS